MVGAARDACPRPSFARRTLLPAAPAAQAPAGGAPVLRAESRVVRVDVIVTDKKGHYIPDLAAKDFHVFDNDKEQPIVNFSFGASEGAAATPDRHYVVLLFDDATMNIADQPSARQAALKFIDANAGPDRVMAVAISPARCASSRISPWMPTASRGPPRVTSLLRFQPTAQTICRRPVTYPALRTRRFPTPRTISASTLSCSQSAASPGISRRFRAARASSFSRTAFPADARTAGRADGNDLDMQPGKRRSVSAGRARLDRGSSRSWRPTAARRWLRTSFVRRVPCARHG